MGDTPMQSHEDEPSSGRPVADARKAELARRLNLLLDALVAENGQPYTYAEIAAALLLKGQKLLRPRWSYMLAGNGPLVDDPRLLQSIAEFFDIKAAYLVEWGNSDIPARIESQLEFVRTLRINRITSFAARQIGGPLSAEGLRAITETIEAEMNGRRMKRESATDQS